MSKRIPSTNLNPQVDQAADDNSANRRPYGYQQNFQSNQSFNQSNQQSNSNRIRSPNRRRFPPTRYPNQQPLPPNRFTNQQFLPPNRFPNQQFLPPNRFPNQQPFPPNRSERLNQYDSHNQMKRQQKVIPSSPPHRSKYEQFLQTRSKNQHRPTPHPYPPNKRTPAHQEAFRKKTSYIPDRNPSLDVKRQTRNEFSSGRYHSPDNQNRSPPQNYSSFMNKSVVQNQPHLYTQNGPPDQFNPATRSPHMDQAHYMPQFVQGRQPSPIDHSEYTFNEFGNEINLSSMDQPQIKNQTVPQFDKEKNHPASSRFDQEKESPIIQSDTRSQSMPKHRYPSLITKPKKINQRANQNISDNQQPVSSAKLSPLTNQNDNINERFSPESSLLTSFLPTSISQSLSSLSNIISFRTIVFLVNLGFEAMMVTLVACLWAFCGFILYRSHTASRNMPFGGERNSLIKIRNICGISLIVYALVIFLECIHLLAAIKVFIDSKRSEKKMKS